MTKIHFALIPFLLVAFTVISAELFTTQAAHAGANGYPVLHVTVNEPNIQAVKLSFRDINGNQMNPCVLLTTTNRPDTEINYYIQPNASLWVGVYAYDSPINQSSPCAGSVDEALSKVEQVSGDYTVVT